VTDKSSLRRLIKDCETVASDRLTSGKAVEVLTDTIGTLEAYALDLAELARLRKIEAVAGRIAKTVKIDVSAGGTTDSGAFVSKAVARDLLALLKN